tara:strand:- start:690 stop:956 length:267 start_codon:yes stop_codon:yes gene_type:complete
MLVINTLSSHENAISLQLDYPKFQARNWENLHQEKGKTLTMVAELVAPAVEAMGDFMDAEENKWWVRPLKALIYIGVFSVIPLYFYFI